MKKIKIVEIAKKLKVSHSAVSQWFSGNTKPTAENMFLLKDHFEIPLDAWRDIKSYISNDTKQDSSKSHPESNAKVSA